MDANDVVTIGRDRYLIHPDGKGEYALPTSLEEHLAAQLPRQEEALPGYIPEYSTTWRREQELQAEAGKCLMPGCPKPAVKRDNGKFCGYRHERAYQARRYRRRKQNITSWLETVNGVAERFERRFPGSMQTARKQFAEHITPGVCQFGGSHGECPSTKNPYADPSLPRCLIYATQADDLLVWTARHRGYVVERRYTTGDGAWKDQPWTPPTQPLDSS